MQDCSILWSQYWGDKEMPLLEGIRLGGNGGKMLKQNLGL